MNSLFLVVVSGVSVDSKDIVSWVIIRRRCAMQRTVVDDDDSRVLGVGGLVSYIVMKGDRDCLNVNTDDSYLQCCCSVPPSPV